MSTSQSSTRCRCCPPWQRTPPSRCCCRMACTRRRPARPCRCLPRTRCTSRRRPRRCTLCRMCTPRRPRCLAEIAGETTSTACRRGPPPPPSTCCCRRLCTRRCPARLCRCLLRTGCTCRRRPRRCTPRRRCTRSMRCCRRAPTCSGCIGSTPPQSTSGPPRTHGRHSRSRL